MSISGNWDRRLSRRAFLGLGGMSVAALALAPRGALAQTSRSAGYGDLVPDPGGLIALPKDFQYRVISPEGATLSGGGTVPGDPDGMAALQGPGTTTLLVRNHELRPGDLNSVVGKNPYGPAGPGGTTGILVGPDREVIKDFVASSGTLNNCAVGATPWGTWLTCEEDRTTDHGYVFEVNPHYPENRLSREPIRAMGFFAHEAVSVDPDTGICYLTEDDQRGIIPTDPNAEAARDRTTSEGGLGSRVSFLYRYIPYDRTRRPGALHAGGKLQVMTVEGGDINADLAKRGQEFRVVWRKVDPEDPHEEAEQLGAARFNRLEGAHFAGGAFWFDDTVGGEERRGQIFRYLPAARKLELFYEGTGATDIEMPDNITVTPWGDLWFAEDGSGENRILGLTPAGEIYEFASNGLSEFAGPTFAPDGKTFFVNLQGEGLTFAIWGPFAHRDAARQHRMATAAPPEALAPRVSAGLAEAAERQGMSRLEAAAFDRLGVPLT